MDTSLNPHKRRARMSEVTDRSTKVKEEKADIASTLSARGLVLVLATAILTGAVSYAFGVASDIRKAKLDFVNAQIEKLYGPLYAASQANNEVWKLFTADRWRERDAKEESRAFFDDKNPPTVDQVRRWRHWMRTVFQPLNLKMEEAIVSNSQLLVGDTEPIAFRDLIAHAEAYKAVIVAWDGDDLAKRHQAAPRTQAAAPCPAVMRLANTAGSNYPEAVVPCIEEDYAKLRRRRQELQNSLIAAFTAPSLAASPACNRSSSG
jgi:hypothetical protein